MRAKFFLSFVVTAAAFTLNAATSTENAPDTPKKPVSTEYHGVTLEDPYQWLEADDDSQVKAWSDAENQQARKYLDGLPDRAAIEKQLQEWYAKTSPNYFSLVSRPGILFAMKFQPPKQQPLLVTLASADDLKSEKVVLDPNVLDTKGTTTIDWFVPSSDGKYLAISLSKGGSEDGTLHFYETATGKALPDTAGDGFRAPGRPRHRSCTGTPRLPASRRCPLTRRSLPRRRARPPAAPPAGARGRTA